MKNFGSAMKLISDVALASCSNCAFLRKTVLQEVLSGCPPRFIYTPVPSLGGFLDQHALSRTTTIVK
jgi:hypothetical protein